MKYFQRSKIARSLRKPFTTVVKSAVILKKQILQKGVDPSETAADGQHKQIGFSDLFLGF